MDTVSFLIEKYGDVVLKNNVFIYAFIERNTKSIYKLTKNIASLDFILIYTEDNVVTEDVFIINSDEYLVYDIKGFYKNNLLMYNEVLIFKNDFDKDIEIYSKKIEGFARLNRPKKENVLLATKARLKTVSPVEQLQYGYLEGGPAVTHKFIILYINDTYVNFQNNYIMLNNKLYLIVNIENMDENNKLIIFYTREVINR